MESFCSKICGHLQATTSILGTTPADRLSSTNGEQPYFSFWHITLPSPLLHTHCDLPSPLAQDLGPPPQLTLQTVASPFPFPVAALCEASLAITFDLDIQGFLPVIFESLANH